MAVMDWDSPAGVDGLSREIAGKDALKQCARIAHVKFTGTASNPTC